ncbi:MAG TPA: SGNH/GDSL hydrolase family protein [Allosphingosinicella sp.]|nr:SGNH/GDSL hydrolase family protein [Allosphingosinicella sp.]
MRHLILSAAALLLGGASGISFGYARWHGLFPGYVAHRALVINGQSPFVPDGSALALGDSTVERVYTADLCGGMFNAAVGWATTSDLIRTAPKLIAEVRPRLIVLDAGYNDLSAGSSIEDLRARELKLVAMAGPTRLVMMGIPRHPDASRMVQAIAAEHHEQYIPPIEGAVLTVDGVHENRRGMEEWRRRVAAACR